MVRFCVLTASLQYLLSFIFVSQMKKKSNSKSRGQAWKISAQEHLKQMFKMVDHRSNNVIA